MPFLQSVVEGREKAEEILANNIGDELDPFKEQEDDDDANEGVKGHPELFIKDPTGLKNDNEIGNRKDNIYRKIELSKDSQIHDQIRSLDPEQRQVVDICVKFAKEFVKATKSHNPKPCAPLLFVHGGAGTGKSTLIFAITQITEKIFRTPGDSPIHPYVLKTAFTGNAAHIIKGQTLHSAFQFTWGNQILALSDKTRDQRRKLLQNLRMVIVDEISLVKSDMLYQLHFQLMKDIFQNDMAFGGIALIVCGDILQIKPPKGNFIYDKPSDARLKMCYQIEDLWKKFSVITLLTNHRQGEDKNYAELLNRLRVGKQTEDDIKLLATRVFAENDPRIPDDAFHIAGTNAAVNKVNAKKLSKLPGELVELPANVTSDMKGRIEPKVDKKMTFLELHYKKISF